jgi:hypothetical protein
MISFTLSPRLLFPIIILSQITAHLKSLISITANDDAPIYIPNQTVIISFAFYYSMNNRPNYAVTIPGVTIHSLMKDNRHKQRDANQPGQTATPTGRLSEQATGDVYGQLHKGGRG